LGQAVPLLNLAFELVAAAADDGEIIVGGLASLLLRLPLDLIPGSPPRASSSFGLAGNVFRIKNVPRAGTFRCPTGLNQREVAKRLNWWRQNLSTP
jgi:hypothetical protein